MKKILTHLTGIVFIITILAAGGCNSSEKKNDSAQEGTASTKEEGDPGLAAPEEKKVDVFLKDTLILGTMHLLMSDSKKLECKVIDTHTAVVYPGYTVNWRKADDSRIDKILHILPVPAGDSTMFGALVEEEIDAKGKKFYKLEIPDAPLLDTIVKYEIIFTIEEDTTTIDPYLRIPKQHGI
jgi:hypothetical protein